MKIVQVGGGTAGWMTALAISKSLSNVDLTVIHDDNPIGVGEATFENIRHYHSFLGISEKEFMKASDATYKFGIWFDDFLKKGESYCHLFKYGILSHPFEYPHHYKDIESRRSHDGHKPMTGIEWSKFMNFNTRFLLKNKIPMVSELLQQDEQYQEDEAEHRHGTPRHHGPLRGAMPMRFLGGHGYHMDAIKYQTFLKSKLFDTSGVNCKIIKSTVEDVKIGDNGIEWITIAKDPSIKVKADLFIDCTGFNRVLIKSFGDTWEDFGELLPNNRAVVCRTPYTDPEKEMAPFVRCTAMDSGWKWTIPLYSRLSHGYVYSDNYISPDWAEIELRDKVGMVDPTKSHGGEYEGDVNHIQFKSGVLKRSWVKNCVALGLSSFFVEPLESTGIAIFVRQIIDMLKILEKGFVKRLDRDVYNITNVNDSTTIKNFIAHHFLHTLREDTEYWKDWKYNRTLDEEALNSFKWIREGSATFTEIAYLQGMNQSSIFFPPGAVDQILSSMGGGDYQNPIALRYQNLHDFPDQLCDWNGTTYSDKQQYDRFLEQKVEYDNWMIKQVDESPNHYDYVRKKIHEG